MLKLQKYKVAAAVVVIHTRLVLILGNLVDLVVVAVTCLAHNPVELEISPDQRVLAWDILAVTVVLLQHTTVEVVVVPVVLVLLLVLEPSVVLVDLGVRYGLLNHHQLQQYKHL